MLDYDLVVYLEVSKRLGLALAIGAAIGFERSYHGRPAGFRTHALVSLSSALLMLITVYQASWFVPTDGARTTLDPTRMAQGIMTGIGFLGAGAILKESMTIRGLTTAASIWITAALGLIAGVGLFFPALLGTALALGVLSAFRLIERRIPSQIYAVCRVRFVQDQVMGEAELRQLVDDHGFSATPLSYSRIAQGGLFQYSMTIRADRATSLSPLAETLSGLSMVHEFDLAPIGI